MVIKKKFLLKYIVSFIIILILIIIGFTKIPEKSEINYSDFELDSFKSLDAKLAYEGYIITSHTNKLCLIDSTTLKIKEFGVPSQWVGAISDNNAIVYTNKESVTRCGRIDLDNTSIIGNYEILDTDSPTIDPAITRYDGKYYLCVTRINGNINNGNADVKNGLYSIELYTSTNLENWEFITKIYSAFKNLEDVKFSKSDELEIIFEEENLDKGSSKILKCQSDDKGKTWTEPVVIIDDSSDNEPAALFKIDDHYYVFYSSDKENKGKSYSGASAYFNQYTQDFDLIETRKIPLKFDDAILLYDVEITDENIYLLYSHDYNGTNDLCLNTLDKSFLNSENN